jgi:hypothetical protein
MNLAKSKTCSFCSESEETIEHLFFNCKKTRELWEKIRHFFRPNLELPPLTLYSAFFGLPNSEQIEGQIHSTFEILVYKSREKKKCSIEHFISKLKILMKIEFNMTFTNERKRGYNKQKWAKIALKLT